MSIWQYDKGRIRIRMYNDLIFILPTFGYSSDTSEICFMWLSVEVNFYIGK